MASVIFHSRSDDAVSESPSMPSLSGSRGVSSVARDNKNIAGMNMMAIIDSSIQCGSRMKVFIPISWLP